MRNKIIFGLAAAGLVAALISAYFMGQKPPTLPPAFKPFENPYPNGIYAEGIIESAQPSASDIDLFPEVGATVTRIHVSEGQHVEKGDLLIELDDTVPRAQAAAALATWESAEKTLAKDRRAYRLDPGSISRDALDSAIQLAATYKGTYDAAVALDVKYTLRAPSSGVVTQVNTTTRSYVSSQGVYDPYTQGYDPPVVMGSSIAGLQLRCYVDEILIPRLPPVSRIKAQMEVRGTDIRIPLSFVRVQPFVSPKIQLTDERQERVDVRVLPVIFSFPKPQNVQVFAGELVDVYIGE
jgi:HlyD family secretion protein